MWVLSITPAHCGNPQMSLNPWVISNTSWHEGLTRNCPLRLATTAVTNSSNVSHAVDRPMPKRSCTVLYLQPVARRQRPTATRFSTLIGWKKDNHYQYTGIEFKGFILGFCQSTFLCTTLKCIERSRIPFIKSGIPASKLGSSEARNTAKFAAWVYFKKSLLLWSYKESCCLMKVTQNHV